MMTHPPESDKFINEGIVCNKKGEVLVVRRAKEEIGEGGAVLRWAFPGGSQRLDESRTECVKRHILRRTGYDVKVIKQISLRVHPQFLVLIAYHLCELAAPEPVAPPAEPGEVAEIKWVSVKEIYDLFTTDLDSDVRRALEFAEKKNHAHP